MPKIIVYTKTVCPYCSSAKALLQNLKLSYEEINLDGKDELRAKLSEENKGFRTVPMIFINDKFIGGFDDLNVAYKNGELSKYIGQP